MRFIKRFIFVIILLLIAFFIYRLISPQGAKQLLYDLKLSSNSTIGTEFSLSGDIAPLTGTSLDMTGTLLVQTGALFEITDDEELLLTDAELYQESVFIDTTTTGTVSSGTSTTGSSSLLTTTTTAVPVAPKVTTSKKTTTVSKGLSAQDKRDINDFLKNFGN